MKRFLVLLTACGLVMALSGCGNIFKAKSLAEPKVEEFHQLLNAEKYNDIYAASAPAFQKATSEDQLTTLLSAIHRKLGAEKSSVNSNWNISSYNLETRVVLIQKTEFEQGSATETFTYLISDNAAVLLGYNIQSNDLITR